jgi:hypothetical protein
MVKISGPSSGQPSEGVGDAPDVERSGGKGFAGALGKTESASGPAAQGPAAPPSSQSFVGDIGQRLESGEITPADAVDEVVDRVLDDKLGLDASPTLRSQVEGFMREKLDSDPLLAEKLKSLSA